MPRAVAPTGGGQPQAPEDIPLDPFAHSVKRISQVEEHSNATLPTPVSLALADSQIRDEELNRAANMAAYALDVSPNYLFKPSEITAGAYTDPVTGGPLSLETARRLIDVNKTSIVRGIIDQISAGGDGKKPADPLQVARYLQAMNSVPGDHLPMAQALGAAMLMAGSGVDPKAFESNLQAAVDINGISDLQAIAIAHDAAGNKVHFANRFDALRYALPDIARSTTRAQVEATTGTRAPGLPGPRVPGITQVAEFKAAGLGFIDAISKNTDDYFKLGQQLQGQITLDREHFAKSPIGRALHVANKYVVTPVVGATDVVLYTAAKGFENQTPQAVAGQIPKSNYVKDVHDLFFQRKMMGDLVARDLNLPHWTAPVIEFAASWYLAPDVIALKAVKAGNYAKLITEAGGAATWADRTEKAFTTPIRDMRLSGLGKFIPYGDSRTIPQFIVDIVKDAATPEDAWTTLTKAFRNHFTGEPIGYSTLEHVWRHVAGNPSLTREEASKSVLGLLLGASGFRPPADSFAEAVARAEQADVERTDQVLAHDLVDPGTYRIDPERASQYVDTAVRSLVDDFRSWNFGGAPELVEIPSVRGPLSRGLVRWGLARSGDNIGARVRELLQGAPPPSGPGEYLINAEESVVKDVRRVAAMARLDPAEVSDFEHAAARVADIRNPTRSIEFAALADRLDDAVITQAQKEFGVSNDVMESVLHGIRGDRPGGVTGGNLFGFVRRSRSIPQLERELERLTAEREALLAKTRDGVIQRRLTQNAANVKETNARLKIVKEGGDPASLYFDVIDEPLGIRTQQNYGRVIDPAAFRRALSETVGAYHRMKGAAETAYKGKNLPEKVAQAVDIKGTKLVHEAGDFQRAFLRVWKTLAVIKPSYIMRVGLDETLRSFSTVGVADWLRSQRWTRPVSAAWDHAIGTPEVRLKLRIPNPDGTERIVDHVESFPSSGSMHYASDELANVKDQMHLLGLNSRKTMERLAGGGRASGEFEPLSFDGPKAKQAAERWAHVLNVDFGTEPMWRVALRAMADKNHTWTDDEIMGAIGGLFKRDPTYEKAIMGTSEYAHESLDQFLRDRLDYLHQLVADQPNVAEAALFHRVDPSDIERIPSDLRPAQVHGPMVDVGSSRSTGIKAAGRIIRRSIVAGPTNTLQRQPMFRFWYRRMGQTLLKGVEGQTLTPEQLERFHDVARKFALGQVDRVLFNYLRSGRVGEALDWVAPFFQPFVEAFVVWGRIARQNPVIAARIPQLYELGKKTGFIGTDPTTGEDTVSENYLKWGFPIASVLQAGSKVPDKNAFNFFAPLASLNVFFGGAFPVPLPGGGEVPLPTPGLNPFLNVIGQKILENPDLPIPGRIRALNWLTQYGAAPAGIPKTAGYFAGSLLPAYLRHMLEGFAGESVLTKGEIDNTADKFLALDQSLGMLKGLSPKEQVALSLNQARSFSYLRAYMSAFGFASPRIEFPTQHLEDEFSADLQKFHGDYLAAAKAFNDKYDHRYDLITISRSIWNAAPDNPVPIPANKAVQKLLDSPAGRAFAKDHPAWVWAIIPHELRDGTFDFGVFFSQISDGLRRTRSPMEFISEGEKQNAWDGYFAARDQWTATQERLKSEGISTTDATWIRAEQTYTAQVDELKRQYPLWAVDFGSVQRQNVDPQVMAEARDLAADKTFQKTSVGKGLNEYLQLRDRIQGEMAQNEITNITTIHAEQLGLTKKYNDGLAAIEKQYPDFAIAYRTFFSADLQKVQTAAEKAIAALPPAVAAQGEKWSTQWSQDRAAPNQASTASQADQAYLTLRQQEDSAYTQFASGQNPLVLRWKAKDTIEKRDYLMSSVTGRPYVFMSRFTKETILGEKTDASTENLWEQYDAARLQIAQVQEQATIQGQNISVGALYDQLDAWVAANARSNPTFAAQVAHANDWGYVVEKTIPVIYGENNPARQYWANVIAASRQVEQLAVSNGLHSTTDFDTRKAQAYASLRQQFMDYVQRLRDIQPTFNEQWTAMEDSNGTRSLFDTLMPETFYALGAPSK